MKTKVIYIVTETELSNPDVVLSNKSFSNWMECSKYIYSRLPFVGFIHLKRISRIV